MIQITSEPISPQLVIDKVKKDCYGAIISFVGTVRDTTQGRKVSFLQIETRDENEDPSSPHGAWRGATG